MPEPLCPVDSRCSTTSSISWAGSTPSRGVGKGPTRSGSLRLLPPGYRRLLFCLFRSATYPRRPSAASSTLVGAAISRLAFSPILQIPLNTILWLILSRPLRAYQGPQGRRERLTSTARCWSWAAAEPRRTHRMRWMPTLQVVTVGQLTRLFPHSSLRGATSPPIPTAPAASGWQAVTLLPRQRPRWKSSNALPLRLHLRLL